MNPSGSRGGEPLAAFPVLWRRQAPPGTALCSRRSTTAPDAGPRTRRRDDRLSKRTGRGPGPPFPPPPAFWFCFYEALSDCAKFPRPPLPPTPGTRRSFHQHQQELLQFLTVHTVSTGTVYKENYMKNNIIKFRFLNAKRTIVLRTVNAKISQRDASVSPTTRRRFKCPVETRHGSCELLIESTSSILSVSSVSIAFRSGD